MGTLFSTERSPLFSRACLPRHRSYQATLYGLNGLAGKAAPHYPPPPLLCSHPDHVCFLQLPPLSHSAYPTPPKNISASSFLSVFSFLLIPFYVLPVVSFSFLRVILLHNDLLLSAFSFPESRCFNNTVKFISSSTQLKTFSTLPLSLCFPLINQPLL